MEDIMKLIYLSLATALFALPAFATDMADDFETIDVNHDGIITPSEMATAQRASLESQNSGIMNLLDTNGDGTVTNEEYMAFYGKLATGDKELEQVKAQFKNLDADGNGEISATELSSFREGSIDKENEEFFQAVDTDKNGQISQKEYDVFVEGLKGIFNSVNSDYLK